MNAIFSQQISILFNTNVVTIQMLEVCFERADDICPLACREMLC
jgi:hypothetical protein